MSSATRCRLSINGGLTPTCGDLAVTVRILEGDLNLDCKVDVTDEQLISFRYGAFFGDLLYNKWYDLEPATARPRHRHQGPAEGLRPRRQDLPGADPGAAARDPPTPFG